MVSYLPTIISKTNMKNLKKLSKYFVATFSIVLVCGFTGLVIKEVDKGTFYDLATKEALVFCMQLGLAAFTSLIPYSLSVAAFLSFWAMNGEKWTGFFRALAIGLVLVLPLSAMTYYYDWFIRPQTTAVSAGEIIEMKQTYPQELADKFGIDKEQVLNKMPMTMPKTKLAARMDSLKASFQTDADTCGLLLSILPDTLASEAYESYRLKEMGVAYQYAVHPAASEDSLMFIQHTELYQRAIRAWDTLAELQRHRKEYFDRTLNTACIYIMYFLFAFIGYLLRYKSIKKILTAFAILIVAAWIYHEISSIVQAHAQKVNTVSKQIVSTTYEEIKENREKERNTDND